MMEQGPRFTVLELAANKTIDLRLAALLWLVMERKGSIIVGAGPRLAGKTTLLMAALDFLPPQIQQVATRGMKEKFSFLQETDPKKTMILCAEISDHVPEHYIWGAGVTRVFQAMSQGYSLGATMHADTPQEILGMLASPPMNIPSEHLARLTLIINLQVLPPGAGGEVLRRVATVSVPGPASGEDALPVTTIAHRNPTKDSLEHTLPFQALTSLSHQLGLRPEGIGSALVERERRLKAIWEQGNIKHEEFRRAALSYY